MIQIQFYSYIAQYRENTVFTLRSTGEEVTADRLKVGDYVTGHGTVVGIEQTGGTQ